MLSQAQDYMSDLLAFLETIAAWVALLGVPSNSLMPPPAHNMTSDGGTDHIFVNGNLARVLLSTWRLQEAKRKGSGDTEYLRQGLAWCDTLVDLQAVTVSSHGNQAGYWGVGYPVPPNCSVPLRGWCAAAGSIYFGDTGTAVTALSLCHHLSPDAAQRARFLSTMRRFATFVLEGSAEPPVNKKGTATGFVDPATGSVGCGYYHCSGRTSEDCARLPGPSLDCPSRSPYTVATGTTGGAFFAELYGATRNASHAEVAVRAMAYEASVALPAGEVPYLLDGANCTSTNCSSGRWPSVGGPWPFDTCSYVTEGVAAVALHVPSAQATLVSAWEPTVRWLVRVQSADGTWGVGGDAMRSPRVLTLLSWWLWAKAPGDDAAVRAAIERYLDFLRQSGRGAYGLNRNTITTGMAGIAVADAIAFGASFGVALSPPPSPPPPPPLPPPPPPPPLPTHLPVVRGNPARL